MSHLPGPFHRYVPTIIFFSLSKVNPELYIDIESCLEADWWGKNFGGMCKKRKKRKKKVPDAWRTVQEVLIKETAGECEDNKGSG